MENQFLSSLFLVGEKDGGNHPVISLKEINKSILYAHFKMEELFLFKELLMTGNLLRNIDLKYAILQFHRLTKNCKIPVERQFIKISIPLFQPLFSTKSIYKAHESNNFSVEKILHQNCNLLGPYAFNGGLKGRTFNCSECTNKPTTESGISCQC